MRQIADRAMIPVVLCPLAMLVLAIVAGGAQAADGRPNMILFIADDMAWNDCGAYGHSKIRTPGVDRLAAEGMTFNAAFLTCSSCSPSRASIITGRYPHNTGAHQLHLPLPGEQVTFVEKLKESGYYTAAAGKWHLGNETIPKFDVVETKMNRWVETLQKRPMDRPFFMWFAFTDPHRPYQANTIETPHRPEDVVVPPFLPDVDETRADLAEYYDEITRLDGVVEAVQDELGRQGVARDTCIVFISDNGRPFPRCKTTVFDSGIRTPFVVKWPAIVPAGSVSDSLVSSIDLAPTFLDLAGVGTSSSFQGVSLLRILHDPAATVRDYVFAEHNWHDFEDHGRAVRDGRFKYIRNAYPDVPAVPPADAVRSPTYRVMLKMLAEGTLNDLQMQCFQLPRPAEELYDLASDPYELHNRADDPELTGELARLRRTLTRWEQETDDRVPETRRADEFDRQTGDRLKTRRK